MTENYENNDKMLTLAICLKGNIGGKISHLHIQGFRSTKVEVKLFHHNLSINTLVISRPAMSKVLYLPTPNANLLNSSACWLHQYHKISVSTEYHDFNTVVLVLFHGVLVMAEGAAWGILSEPMWLFGPYEWFLSGQYYHNGGHGHNDINSFMIMIMMMIPTDKQWSRAGLHTVCISLWVPCK